MRPRFLLVTLLVALLLPAAASRADNPRLEAIVGTNDAFVITLNDASGTRVTHLDPGTYTILAHDRSQLHDFHLTGPQGSGVDVATDVEGVGDSTFTVTFADGLTYNYMCDVHPSTMHGSFTVGNVPEPPPPPTKLVGRVGPGPAISLRFPNGKRTGAISPGKVVLTVIDRSRMDNFHLRGQGVNRATGIVFRGKVVWRVKIVPGRYTFRSDRHPGLRGSLSVAAPG